MRYPLIAAALIACITACQRPMPVRGVIVKKDYRPAWTQVSVVPIYMGSDANGMPMYSYMPQTTYWPESWDVVVQNDGTTGEEGQFLVEVSHDYYENVHVGGIWKRWDTVDQSK